MTKLMKLKKSFTVIGTRSRKSLYLRLCKEVRERKPKPRAQNLRVKARPLVKVVKVKVRVKNLADPKQPRKNPHLRAKVKVKVNPNQTPLNQLRNPPRRKQNNLVEFN